jgi:hypothetical protein
MTTLRRSPFYALCLVLGALLFGVAGLFHPVLEGDGATQLALIASLPAWRTIHWSLLFALPLMLAGLAGLSLRHQDTPGAGPARAGVIVATFGFAALMINILFMAVAGWHLARTYAVAEPGIAATHAVFLYDMMHPMGLAAERLATFALGLAFYLIGWATWHGRVLPRWVALGAFLAGAICMVVPLVVLETSVWLFYAQGTFIVWMAAAGVAMLVRPSPPA